MIMAAGVGKPIVKRAPPKKAGKPILHLTDPRLDFRRAVPLRKSYLVASSYRCGSTFLCMELWRTGLLGAPWEYFNTRKGQSTGSIQDAMMKRLHASSAQDYVAKLVACRTSKNGVFGVKSHFHDFEAMLKKYPGMLDALAPVTYIFMDRRDKLAQAVSMARAMQTHSWISLAKPDLANLRYDRELISECLGKSEMQRIGWQRWFDARDINPFVVFYEDMMLNPAGVVRSVVEYFDVQDDEANVVRLPPVRKQSDDTNAEWVARFQREVESGVVTTEDSVSGQRPPAQAAPRRSSGESGAQQEPPETARQQVSGLAPARETPVKNKAQSAAGPASGHFFDRYPVFARGEEPRRLRLRHRYAAIIEQNRQLFANARALHVGSADGVWCMAALDAGAARVVGIEPNRKRADAAKATFEKLGVEAGSYQFVGKQVFQALQTFKPGEFDLLLSTGFFEQTDPRYFFDHLRRLGIKHVILDTAVVPGANPVMRFALKPQGEAARQSAPLSASIVATPSYELIAFLSDIYGYRWQTVDFRKMSISDWKGIHDYQNDRRRTYVLKLES